MEKMSKYLIKVLDQIRKEQKLSQEVFAAKIKMSRTYYQDLIKGEYQVTFDKIYEACEELGIHINEIILKAEDLKVELNKKKEVA